MTQNDDLNPTPQTAETDEFYGSIWWVPDGPGKLRSATLGEASREIERLKKENDNLRALIGADPQTAAQVIRDRQLMVIHDGLAQLTGTYVSRYDALRIMELVVTTMGATVPLENHND